MLTYGRLKQQYEAISFCVFFVYSQTSDGQQIKNY